MRQEPLTLWNSSFPDLTGLKKPKLKARSLRPTSPIDIFESDRRAIYELGSPAYRVARNRSGLGYVETQAELARFEGTMLRWLFTGKFYTTTEPLVLLGMICAGMLLGGIPLALILAALLFDGFIPALFPLMSGILNILVGLSLLGGVIQSIRFWNRKKGKPETQGI